MPIRCHIMLTFHSESIESLRACHTISISEVTKYQCLSLGSLCSVHGKEENVPDNEGHIVLAKCQLILDIRKRHALKYANVLPEEIDTVCGFHIGYCEKVHCISKTTSRFYESRKSSLLKRPEN